MNPFNYVARIAEIEDDLGDMSNTHEERKVDRFEKYGDGGEYESHELILVVDTCAIPDSSKPYETAVSDVRYNPGSWAVVELYDTFEEAQAGHQKWIERMIGDNPPEGLRDMTTSKYLIDLIEGDDDRPWFPRMEEEK